VVAHQQELTRRAENLMEESQQVGARLAQRMWQRTDPPRDATVGKPSDHDATSGL
jgi:hypothetical protein